MAQRVLAFAAHSYGNRFFSPYTDASLPLPSQSPSVDTWSSGSWQWGPLNNTAGALMGNVIAALNGDSSHILDTAVGGTTLAPETPSSASQSWLSGATGNPFAAATSAVISANNTTVTDLIVMLDQNDAWGPSGIAAPQSWDDTQAERRWKLYMGQLVSEWKNFDGTALKFWVVVAGAVTSRGPFGGAIRRAQMKLSAISNVFVGPDSYDLVPNSSGHLDPTVTGVLSRRLAVAITGGPAHGPVPTGASLSGTSLTINFQHVGGTSLQVPNSGAQPSGWEITDKASGRLVTPSACSVNSSSIVFTLSATPAAGVTVTHQMSDFGVDQSNVLTDNYTNATAGISGLPAQATIAAMNA